MKLFFTKEHIELGKSERLYDGFMKLDKVSFNHQLFNGGLALNVEREILKRDDAVGVLLFDPVKDAFVMIEQLRIGAYDDVNSPWLLEIVAGMVEPGECFEEVARRESLEEATCDILKLTPIQEYWVSPGGSTEKVMLYLGLVDSSNLAQYAGLEEENEDIKIHKIPKVEMLELLQQGKVNNAMAIIALQWFVINESDLKLSW